MRICILGSSCSGKSTLANNLSKKYTLPVLHLDQIYFEDSTQWLPGPLDDFVNEHNNFIQQDSWVIDGNYYICMPGRFARATTVITLQINLFKCFSNCAARIFRKDGLRFGMLEGAKDNLNWKLFLYIIKYKFKLKKYEALIKQYPHLDVIKLNSYDQINNFLNQKFDKIYSL